MQALPCLFSPGCDRANKAPGHSYNNDMYRMRKTDETALLAVLFKSLWIISKKGNGGGT